MSKSHPASLLKAFALLLSCSLSLALAPGLLAQETPAETPAPAPAPAEAPATAEKTPPPAEGTPAAEATPPAEGAGPAEKTEAAPAKTELEEFEQKASEVRTPQAAQALVDETFAAKDLKRLAICMNYAPLLTFATQKFAAEPPSEFKDKLTMALIDRPWDSDQGTGAPAARMRTVPPADPFLPYATYIQSRVKGVIDPRKKEDVQKAGTSLEERTNIAHKFDRALIKAGLSSVKGKPSARPRKDWKPGDKDDDEESSEDGATAEAGGGSMGLWIGVGAAVLLAVGGFFAFRRKG